MRTLVYPSKLGINSERNQENILTKHLDPILKIEPGRVGAYTLASSHPATLDLVKFFRAECPNGTTNSVSVSLQGHQAQA
ncbi:hypothetical protein Q6247_26005, partial [Klebsiella pneumoniae]